MTYPSLALLLFAFVSSITPGPNNIMLMASGANFGFWRTGRHMLGVAIGFVVMAFVLGLGLAQTILALPWVEGALTLAACVYMLWLAWKIAHASAPGQGKTGAAPMGFWAAAAFQWINPKAWAMALTAMTVYAPDRSAVGVALVALAFGVVNLPSVSVWTLMGQELRRWLTSPMRLRAFNWTMAAALIASLWPLVQH